MQKISVCGLLLVLSGCTTTGGNIVAVDTNSSWDSHASSVPVENSDIEDLVNAENEDAAIKELNYTRKATEEQNEEPVAVVDQKEINAGF